MFEIIDAVLLLYIAVLETFSVWKQYNPRKYTRNRKGQFTPQLVRRNVE